MIKIAITLPTFFPEEPKCICKVLDSGYDFLHLRKPSATQSQVEGLLNAIPSSYYPRIVLHDFFDLSRTFSLRGVHLNARNPFVPADHCGTISASCHSLEEVLIRKASCDYVFLSPIFDSISKANYSAAFSLSELKEAADCGIIDEKVFALGGVTPGLYPTIEQLRFGGVALLGYVWKPFL